MCVFGWLLTCNHAAAMGRLIRTDTGPTRVTGLNRGKLGAKLAGGPHSSSSSNANQSVRTAS